MRISFLLCFLAFGFSACETTPQHRLDFLGDDARDFGGVRITEQLTRIIEVANTGQQPVILEALVMEQGWDGVLTVVSDASAGSDCTPGLALAVGERCVVSVAFEPANDITYRDSLQVYYRAEDEIAALRVTLAISGAGVLDCSLRADYASSFEAGRVAADAQMSMDVATATAAGAALTADDGYSEGYASSYDVAYERAFASAYDDGRGPGYEDGYAEGASATACSEGANDGYADGFDAGVVDGEEDGLLEGDRAGYDDGYATGFLQGREDTCFVGKVDPDASLPGKCEDQGYDATYSRGPYNAAYAAAVAANIAYLDGVSLGEREGTRAGQMEGNADGYAEGYRDGADLGFADGDADEYAACYQVAIDEGYDDGYVSAYNEFFVYAYDDAFVGAYNDGYADGSFDCL